MCWHECINVICVTIQILGFSVLDQKTEHCWNSSDHKPLDILHQELEAEVNRCFYGFLQCLEVALCLAHLSFLPDSGLSVLQRALCTHTVRSFSGGWNDPQH